MISNRRNVVPNIDRLILSLAETRWQKVFKIVGDVWSVLQKEGKRVDPLKIAVRLEGLVNSGRLELKGNIKHWRYSEVRRPASPRPRRSVVQSLSVKKGNSLALPVERNFFGFSSSAAPRGGAWK